MEVGWIQQGHLKNTMTILVQRIPNEYTNKEDSITIYTKLEESIETKQTKQNNYDEGDNTQI